MSPFAGSSTRLVTRRTRAHRRLDARGEVLISAVRDMVAGEFRDGEVRISDAGSVRVDLRRCAADLADIGGDVVIEASDGDLHIREARGKIHLTAVRVDATLRDERAHTV